MTRGSRRRRRTWQYYAATALVVVLGTVGASILDTSVAYGLKSAWQFLTGADEHHAVAPTEDTATSFPGTISVSYGSVNATSAVFPDGMPDSAPADNHWDPWALENGGTLSDMTVAFLHLTAPTDKPVYIDDVKVRVTSCGPALTGLHLPKIGAGDTFERIINNYLDDAPGPNVALESDSGNSWRFPLWIDRTESEDISVILQAYSGAYQVEIDLEFTYDGGTSTHTIATADDGTPLRITGAANTNAELQMNYGDEQNYSIAAATPAWTPSYSFPQVKAAAPPAVC